MTPELRAEVRARLTAGRPGGGRLRHVEAVVETAGAIAAAGGWDAAIGAAAERAAWLHDALKLDAPDAWREAILAAGERPDPWAEANAPGLLHAQAAAAWAAARGESDGEVLAAVRHHPTGHAEWGPVGKILYISDFAEPTRSYAGTLGTGSLVRLAGSSPAGLATAARRVLSFRLRHQLASDRPIHPDSWSAWNAWTGGDS